jgi:radical SAM protein with 4Fe4S-binding SPASM domain
MAAAHERMIPWTASLELGLGCNLRCVHCYNFDRSGPRPAGRELSAPEWHDVVAQLRASGCHQASLTGGEPTIHPAFFPLLEQTAALGMAASVVSNGTRLTDAAARRLAEFEHVVDVGLSLYGVEAPTHDTVTGLSGSFERTLGAARRLRAAGVPVTLKFTIMDLNVREAGRWPDWAEAEGFFWEVNPYLHPRHDGDPGVTARRPSVEERRAAYRGGLRRTLPRIDEPSDLICNCARSNCAVSAAGDVTPCIAVPMPCGNVRERPFAEIWRDSPELNRIRALKTQDFRQCAPCPLRNTCRRSPGAAYVLTGRYTGVDPWICEDAQIVRDVLDESTRNERAGSWVTNMNHI